MGRRRRVFSQRRTVSQRLLRIISATLVALIALIALVYITLPWTSAFVLTRVLVSQGWGPVSLHVARSDLGGFELHDIALAGEAVTVQRLAMRFTLLDLWRGQVREVALAGVRVNASLNQGGLTIGTKTIALGGGGHLPVTVGQVVIADTVIAVPFGELILATSVAADLIAHEDRWDGRLSFETRSQEGAPPLLALTWEGAFGPAEPTRWPSRGTLELNAAELPIAAGTPLSARGRLQFITGDGAIVVSGNDRVAVNLGALPEALRDTLPPSLAKVLGSGVALQIAGSKGGPSLTWRTTETGVSQEIDASVGLSLGPGSLRATAQARTSGAAGALPDTMVSADLRLDANTFPTPLGSLTGRVRVSNMQGPLTEAEGQLTAELGLANATLGAWSVGSARFTTAGTVRLDGMTLALQPAAVSVIVDGLRGPAGLATTGPVTIGMVPNAREPQRIVFAAGTAAALTFALTTAAARVGITVPRDDDDRETASAEVSQARIEGHVAADGTYDVSLEAQGAVSHALVDARLSRFTMRTQTSRTTGSGELTITRLIGKPERGRTDTGLKIQTDFTYEANVLDMKASLRGAQGAEIGHSTLNADFVREQGKFGIDIPTLRLGPDGTSVREIVGSGPITAASGMVEAQLSHTWNGDRKTGGGRVKVSDLTVQTDDLTLAGLNTEISLTSLVPLKSAGAFQIGAGSIVYGLPMRDLAVTAEIPGDNTLKIAQAGLSVAGGKFGLENASIPLDGTGQSVTVGVSGIDLAVLVAQAKVPGLTATGRLSGTLPLQRTESEWRIVKGRLASDAPGAVRYRPASPPEALTQSSGETVLKALSNFQYDSIAANVNGALAKELRVTLAMRGKNPDLYGGYPISFTLNLGGALGAVLKQGIAGYNIGSDMVERLRGQSENGAPNTP